MPMMEVNDLEVGNQLVVRLGEKVFNVKVEHLFTEGEMGIVLVQCRGYADPFEKGGQELELALLTVCLGLSDRVEVL